MEKRNFIPAPIDNKNLVEDAFEDANEIFGNFYEGKGHREKGLRHLVGFVQVFDKEYPQCVNTEGYVRAKWSFGDNKVEIEILANNPSMEDYEDTKKDICDYYKKQFKSWENEQNVGLRVEFLDYESGMYVSFFYDMDDPNL